MDLLTSLFSVLAFVVELFVTFVWLLCSAVLRFLGRKGVIDEQKVRRRISLVGGAVLFGLVVVGLVSFVQIRSESRKIEKTQSLVAKLADGFAQEIQADENCELAEVAGSDSWGNEIYAVDERKLLSRVVIVSSSGPDGTFGTLDDIRETASVSLSKREIGKNVIGKIKDAVIGEADEAE